MHPTTTRSPLLDDLDWSELNRDPHPSYRRWRADAPIAFLPVLNSWLVTRAEDCEILGKDDIRVDTWNQSSHDFLGPSLLTMTGEPHRMLRSAAETRLRPKMVASYVERRTRPVVRDYLRSLAPRGSADALTDILEAVSVRVVGDVLGIESIDDTTRQRWFTDLFTGMIPTPNADPDVLELAAETRREVDAYFEDAVARVASRPDDSALSSLVNDGTADGRPRSFAEVRGTILLFVMGGFREPGHGASASLLGLLRNPDQARAVRDDPALIPAAIHEGLRWLPPFAFAERRAVTDVEIGGVIIPKGDEINLSLSSAGRDERRYDRADDFDLSRPRLPVAAFGYGAHYCAGHFLAREIEKIVLEEIFATLPDLRLDPEHETVVSGFVDRGVRRLPVVWNA